MGVLADARKARALLRKALRRRRAHIEATALAAEHPLPANGFRIGVYFADGAVNLYQLRQWYGPLEALAERWPVVILSRIATAARALATETALPVAYVPTVRDLERFDATQDLALILYVNQNTRNFQMFRYGRRWHVFINHGESDKMYMTTNQFKAYDYALVAGDAARARLGRALWDFDLDRRAIAIGRPQADHVGGGPRMPVDGRTVVLYAPTWEGDRPAAHYGSVVSHGETLVDRVLASPSHRLFYRPHPRSGVRDRAYRDANRRIVAAIARANASDPSARHVFDDGAALGWQLAVADVAVVDISAMVYDRLAVGKPLMITRPVDPAAAIDDQGYLSACEWLDADAAPRILEELDRIHTDHAAATRLRTWSEHYFGDTSPGAPTARFHAAIGELIARREEWVALTGMA